jgi:hypothetical protein
MAAKENLLASFVRRDPQIEVVHKALVASGLKYRGPSNSQTLLYYARIGGREVGVAALRVGPSVFSFPATFWRQRVHLLGKALDNFASFDRLVTDPAVSSSQYSAGQIYIKPSTIANILSNIGRIVIPAAQAAGASL